MISRWSQIVRLKLLERVENRSRLPHENAAVPVEVTTRDILFRDGPSRLLAEPLHLKRCPLSAVPCPLFPVPCPLSPPTSPLDISKRLRRIRRLDAKRDERLRLSFDDCRGRA